MVRLQQRLVVCGVVSALVVALGLVAWATAMPSSKAQSGTMHNCPPVGKWSIAVWDGPSGTDPANALAACGASAVDAAYSLDPQAHVWLRWFAGRPEVSNLPPLNDMQGLIALGGAEAFATPTPTPRPPTPSPTPTRIGDINGDGAVDCSDFYILRCCWAPPFPECGPYHDRSDLNDDGIVDILDFSMLLSNWTGTSGSCDEPICVR
jgi:hypothetical protein